jgi:hypothetical protein
MVSFTIYHVEGCTNFAHNKQSHGLISRRLRFAIRFQHSIRCDREIVFDGAGVRNMVSFIYGQMGGYAPPFCVGGKQAFPTIYTHPSR